MSLAVVPAVGDVPEVFEVADVPLVVESLYNKYHLIGTLICGVMVGIFIVKALN